MSKVFQSNISFNHVNMLLFGGQDILSYLSLYVETAYAGASLSTAHPVDLVLDAFKDPEVSKTTMHKLQVFLEEVMNIHGRRMVIASVPVTCYVCFVVWFIFHCGPACFGPLPL